MNDAYEDIGPTDTQVIAVAWQEPDNMRPVAPGTFATWFVGPDESHGVRFTDAKTGRRIEGKADDVFSLVWIDDGGVVRTAFRVAMPGVRAVVAKAFD